MTSRKRFKNLIFTLKRQSTNLIFQFRRVIIDFLTVNNNDIINNETLDDVIFVIVDVARHFSFNAFHEAILCDNSPEVWINEIELWRRGHVAKNTRNVLDALDVCSPLVFPNVHKLLRAMAVLPVTRTTNER